MSIQRCSNPAKWKLFYADEDPDTFGLACDECILRIANDEGLALADTEPFEGDRQCGQFAPIVLTVGAE
jgi:hypothetical protein